MGCNHAIHTREHHFARDNGNAPMLTVACGLRGSEIVDAPNRVVSSGFPRRVFKG